MLNPIRGAVIGSIVAFSASQFSFNDGTPPLSVTSIPDSEVNHYENRDEVDDGSFSPYLRGKIDKTKKFSKVAQDNYVDGVSLLSTENPSKEDIETGLVKIKKSADLGNEDARSLLLSIFDHEFAYKENDTHELIETESTRQLEGAAIDLTNFSRHFPYMIVKKVESIYKYGFKAIIYDDPEVKKYEKVVADDLSGAMNKISSALVSDSK